MNTLHNESNTNELRDEWQTAAARARIYADPVTIPNTPCPSNDTFVDYITNSLTEAEQTAFLEHIDACPECRLDLLRLSAEMDTSTQNRDKNIDTLNEDKLRIAIRRPLSFISKRLSIGIALAASVLLIIFSPIFQKHSDEGMLLIAQEVSALPKLRGKAASWIDKKRAESSAQLMDMYQGYLYAGQRKDAQGQPDNDSKKYDNADYFSAGQLIFAAEAFCQRRNPISSQHWDMLRKAWKENIQDGSYLSSLNQQFAKNTPPSCNDLRDAVSILSKGIR
jgi:hypothetical protein